MNDDEMNDQDVLRSLRLMAELEKDVPVSQREIAGRLGIAVGLVNSYLKTLVKKGYVQVKAYPRNRFAYLLTAKGLVEKSQLACRHLGNFHKLYRITRQDSLALFRTLHQRGGERVVFCGLDDLTEIAYLSLREAGLELAAVMDVAAGSRFLGFPVVSLEEGIGAGDGPIVITCLPRAEELKSLLLQRGVAEQSIFSPTYRYEELWR
ncbi:winged helix-turn-helix transcriptional regulator [Trichloromonas sp.]|uniref:winged helix-turn-helix transcriptional regulator n=1 Tax=Trichloromonas sp. TaxID=3069249 RepID=UPI003D815CC0